MQRLSRYSRARYAATSARQLAVYAPHYVACIHRAEEPDQRRVHGSWWDARYAPLSDRCILL